MWLLRQSCVNCTESIKALNTLLLSLDLTCNSSDVFSGCVAFSALLGKAPGLDECSQCPVSQEKWEA